MSAFTKLKYPRGLLLNLKSKALEIRKRSATGKKKDRDERFITIPNSKSAETIAKQLETTGYKVAFTSGKKIGDFMQTKESKVPSEEKSVVYKVPCGACDKVYIGETGRGLETRLKEHKRDLRNLMEHSAFVIHAEETSHLPNWNRAGVIAVCRSKDNRKATEAAYITTSDTINVRTGFLKWAKSAARFGIR